MGERKLHEPLTMPKHPDLLHRINEMSIDIKLFCIDSEEKKKMPEQYTKAQENRTQPTWENVVDLLKEAYNAINEQRYSPIKY